jgi:hypothetical protein
LCLGLLKLIAEIVALLRCLTGQGKPRPKRAHSLPGFVCREVGGDLPDNVVDLGSVGIDVAAKPLDPFPQSGGLLALHASAVKVPQSSVDLAHWSRSTPRSWFLDRERWSRSCLRSVIARRNPSPRSFEAEVDSGQGRIEAAGGGAGAFSSG